MAASTTAAKSPPGAVYDMATAFQNDLDAGLTAANDQMLAAWGEAYASIRTEYDALLAKMAAAKAAGVEISPAWLYQQERLKNALATTKAQVHTFAQQASQAAVQAQQAAVGAAAKAHAKMGAQAMQEAGIAGGFTQLNPDNLQHLVGFLHDGTPLDALFTGLAQETAQMARDALVRGLTLGKGPDWISRRLEQALNIPRWRAETIARTEAQRVYREVARNTYMANAEVLEGWVWVAHLDSRTCPACMAMDGKVMPVGSTLDGHPRCRCAMVPRTPSWGDLIGDDTVPDSRPPIRDGQEWFKAQPKSVQRAVLGPAKWKAWQAGDITLDDLVGRHNDPVWGTMRHERSLSSIKAGKGANWDDAVEITPQAPPVLAPDPEAVASIKATHTLDEIEATLTGMPLTEQGRLNFLAAHKASVGELPKGPVFRPPEPDAVWANKATEKMNAAVLNKGYPSKGYSQTVAIYKAKANGTPGTKVGVVKSLSWQEKVNAQKALADHDAWLQKHLSVKSATKAEGKGIVSGLDHDLLAALEHGDVLKAHTDAGMAAQFMLDATEKARTQAILKAKYDAYLDQQAAAKGWHMKSPTWTKGDHTLTVDEDGWGALVPEPTDGPPYLPPKAVIDTLEHDGWEVPVPDPQPEQVATIVGVLKDKDGFYDLPVAQALEDSLSKGTLGAQEMANISEALSVAKVTHPWKPEPQWVAKIGDEIDKAQDPGAYVKALLEHADEPSTKPLSAANIKAAVDQWKAKVAAAAKVDPPLVDYDAKMDLLTSGKFDPKNVQELLEGGLVPAQHAPTWEKVLADFKTNAAAAKTKAAKVDKTPPPVQASKDAGWGAPPNVADLKSTGQTLGTHGAKVYTDPQGNRWLFKPPKDPGDGFLTTLDEAASRLQARTGLKAPDTFVVTIGGKRGSLQRMFDATDAFPSGLKPDALTDADLLAVQKEHVLDWLLSNHDGHHQQFLRLPDGTLTGIDKGQAFRWMGQDRLDWDFHPNAYYGAPEPVYNTLWRSFAQGHKVEALDPRQGPLADYIKSVQGISDDELRAMFRPYAEQAAARGRLGIRQTQPGLTLPSIPANDVEAFLDAIVARKHSLGDDFTALYDKAAKARQKALPTWSPPKPKAARPATGKAKWKDRPAPVKPEPPKPPAEEAAKTFDSWESKVKAKYESFAPGKKLENSNNWARVRKVIDQRDRQAVQELLDRHYLDDALAQEAYDLIDKAEAKVKAAEAAHAKAMATYERKLAKWKKDTADWREANGIVDLTQGMDGAHRHDTNQQGMAWAKNAMKDPGWTKTEIDAMRYYTTSSGASSLNNTGRRLGEAGLSDTSLWGAEKTRVARIDKAMSKSLIPEDVILHRGTGFDQFTIGGQRLGYSDGHRLADLVGTVQRDYGYMSTSVGERAAFGGSVTLKLRAPAGTRGSYVVSFSHYGESERELLLDRGTQFYVHAVYQKNGTYVVEAEIVPDGFDPSKATPKPSSTPFDH